MPLSDANGMAVKTIIEAGKESAAIQPSANTYAVDAADQSEIGQKMTMAERQQRSPTTMTSTPAKKQLTSTKNAANTDSTAGEPVASRLASMSKQACKDLADTAAPLTKASKTVAATAEESKVVNSTAKASRGKKVTKATKNASGGSNCLQ